MNIKNRIFSLILAISLVVTSSVGTTVFGADWSGRWTFSSGSEDYLDNSAAADSSDVVQKDNSSAQTSEESESISEDSGDMWTYGEQIKEETVADAAANGDMFVYQDENENPSAENQNAEDESKGIVSEEKTLVYEDDSVIISVTGSEKDLPVGTNLSVKEILPDNDMNVIAYAGAITALSETLREQGESCSQARLYDISLVDEQGYEQEPSGVVSVKFEYKDISAFADIDKESIKVAHITEKAEENELSDKQADDESNDIEELGGDDDSQTEENAEAPEDAPQSDTDESILQPEEIVHSSVISEETLAAAQEAAEKLTAEIVDTNVELIDENQPVTVAFVTESFSYYVVFGGSGSATEPANMGNYGWIRFATVGQQDTTPNQTDPVAQWGYYQSNGSNLPALVEGNENAYKRILKINLWLPKAGGNPDIFDENNYEHPANAEAKYFWVWQNQVVIDEFEIPGYEVVHSRMHTAWGEENNMEEKETNGLEGSYVVRGYRASTLSNDPNAKNCDFNELNVYVKRLPTPPNVDTTHYVIRYVHADGSVSDGNEKELWNQNGYRSVYFDQAANCREGETYAGMSIATGVEAITDHNGSTNLETLEQNGKGYISYNSKVDLAKLTIYYKNATEGTGDKNVNTSREYDKNAGKHYTAEKGLYTDKSVTPIENSDGRHYMLNLESWYVDQAVSVGLVLDSSGSMAWTSGIPEQIILPDNLAYSWRNYTNPDSSYIPADQVNWILNVEKTDNSNLNYNGYHYFLKDERDSVNEYVALGYTSGNTITRTIPYSNESQKLAVLAEGCHAVANWGNNDYAGWYYVNSTGKAPVFLEYSGKSYDGYATYNNNKWTRVGPLRFFVKNGNELWVAWYDSSNGLIRQTPVYEKRYKMFTKNETLQDAVSQFGTILLGTSTVNSIAMTRFSQDVVNTYDTSANNDDRTGASENDKKRYFPEIDNKATGFLKLMNWSSSTQDVAAALNQNPTATGKTKRADGTYGYGLTGQTTTYVGVRAFNEIYKSGIPNTNKKYVIIFTDGKDLHRNSAKSDADPEENLGLTGKEVDKLKREGFSIVTILMKSQTFNNDPTGYNRTRTFLRSLASYGMDGNPDNETSGNELYFEADSNSSYELVQSFREIAQIITSGLKGYTVRDYIDPRFDVTNDAGDILTVLDENGAFVNTTNPDVDENGLRGFTTPDHKQAYLGYDSEKKMFYVEWYEQTIPATTVKSESLETWNSHIRIQAKEDFIGGNAVLTNGNDPTLNKVFYPEHETNTSTADSKDYPAKVFPQTSANPAVLDEDLDYTEDTIYLGEAIEAGNKFKWLFETPNNDNLYIEYLKRYKQTAEYWSSDEFLNSDVYQQLEQADKVKINAFVQEYKTNADNLKKQIEDFEADGAEDVAATGSTKETKRQMTLTIPYYYLEDSTVRENQPGTISHMLDRIGELSYTWEATNVTDDPYMKRATTADDPNPMVYTLKVTYTADSMNAHSGEATSLAGREVDGVPVNPNTSTWKEHFNLKLPDRLVDPEDVREHAAGTWTQTVGEGASPTITKRVYLTELENADSDSSDIESTLVSKVYNYLEDAVSNVNGQKDYPFIISDGSRNLSYMLRIKKPEGAEGQHQRNLVYQWFLVNGQDEHGNDILVLKAEEELTNEILADALTSKGYVDLSYTVAENGWSVPDDGNANTYNTVNYTITDQRAGMAIINIVNGKIEIRKQINKAKILKDIDDNGGVVLEFRLKRSYTDPVAEAGTPDTVTPDPGNESGDNTPGTGEKEEYWKLELVLGARPTSTPTPEPSTTPGNGQGGENGQGQEEITYVKTITETITRAKINSLTADEDGYIVIIPEWATQRLPFGTYTVEETEAGDYTMDGIINISNESKKSTYVSVAEGGKSAAVYLNQIVSGVPAEATIDASRTRLNAQEAILQVRNTKEIRTKLILTKKDSVDQNKLLKGVIFEIFTDAACTTKASNTKDAEGTQRDSFITDEEGFLIIDNLEPNKTYYLREKMAASGHYLLTGAIPIVFDADGLLSIGTIVDTELRSHVWLDADTTDEKNDMIVTNSPYYDLPSAGGPGNYIFTIIGVAICAVTILMKFRERTETGKA